MKRLKDTSLFVKIALVGVAGMIAVAVCTLTLALRATERAYVETLTLSNWQVLDGVEADMESANDLITRLLLCMSDSTAFRAYLTSDGTNPAAYRQVYTMSQQLRAVSPDTYDTVALSADGSQWYATNGTSLSQPASQFLSGELAATAQEEPNRIHYRFLPQGITRHSQDSMALVAFKAFVSPGSASVYGYGFVVVPQEELQAFYKEMSTPANTLLLVDPDGTVVSATDSEWVGRRDGDLNAALLEASTQPVSARIEGGSVTLQRKRMPQWGLDLVTILDQHRALREMGGRASIVLATVLVCAAVLCAFFLILRQITRPLHDLVQAMDTAAQRGLSEHVEVHGGSEARELAVAFNAMLDDIHSYVNRLMALEQEKRDIELEALQMQIKPHFIYNTLTSIKWLVWQKETDKAAHCIDDLTLLLRRILGTRQEMVTAEEEIETLKSYVYLQQIRFGEKIRTTYFLPPEAAKCRMPKLLLQPLVENAFFHAFSHRATGGSSPFSCPVRGMIWYAR